MRYIKYFLVFALVTMMCSCSADNSSRPKICERIIFSTADGGNISVTVRYVSDDGSTIPDETLRAADARDAVSLLLRGDTVYKALKNVEMSESLDVQTEKDILCAFMNSDEFQLKCEVVRGGEKCGTLSEYYREKMNAAGDKGENA